MKLTILVELRMALSVAIDVFPGLRVGKCKLIRHGAHDRAIFQVELVHIEGPSSAEETPDAVDLVDVLANGLCGAQWSRWGGLLARCGQRMGRDTLPGGGSKGCRQIQQPDIQQTRVVLVSQGPTHQPLTPEQWESCTKATQLKATVPRLVKMYSTAPIVACFVTCHCHGKLVPLR